MRNYTLDEAAPFFVVAELDATAVSRIATAPCRLLLGGNLGGTTGRRGCLLGLLRRAVHPVGIEKPETRMI